MQKSFTFKSLSNDDTITVTIESKNDIMLDYINAKSEAESQLCEEVEEVEI